MEVAQSALFDVFERVRLWIRPWKGRGRDGRDESEEEEEEEEGRGGGLLETNNKPCAMSRELWVPDQGGHVCYQCELAFSLINRRHHCRVCGFIFCGRCTQNTLPTTDSGPPDHGGSLPSTARVRVCTFCFNKHRFDSLAPPPPPSNEGSASSKYTTPALTASLSSHSFNSSNSTFFSGSFSSSLGYPDRTVASPPPLASAYGGSVDLFAQKKQEKTALSRSFNRSMSPREDGPSSPNPYDFLQNRSDGDDDDNDDNKTVDESHRWFDTHTHPHELDADISVGEMDLHLTDTLEKSQPGTATSVYADHFLAKTNTSHKEGSRNDIKISEFQYTDHLGSSLSRKSSHGDIQISEFQYAGPINQSLSRKSMDDSEALEESVDECNFYSTQNEDLFRDVLQEELVVDIQNNTLLWAPPKPEDEEDEKGTFWNDSDEGGDEGDDGEDDDASFWSAPRSVSSLSNDWRGKGSAASEEQRKVMQAAVDGHFRVLVAQLLAGEGLDKIWLDIAVILSVQAASFVKPDKSKSGGMDPAGYVKVKCIATGERNQSSIVKGVVCSKNVANRHMASKFTSPKLLLLGGALEYHRVSNQLSSIDTLIQQEHEYLRMTVARIEAQHPNILLVEKSVARFAHDQLLEKEISLVSNIKRPLLERIARCTGAQIVPSLDNLNAPICGRCEVFHVDKPIEEHRSEDNQGRKPTKTLMFFEECPKPLGCTVLLKGASFDELKKVKRVVQYAIFAAYHLALETSFLADEGATLPDCSLDSTLSVALPDKLLKSERSITAIPGLMGSGECEVPSGDKFDVKYLRLMNSVQESSPSSNWSSGGQMVLGSDSVLASPSSGLYFPANNEGGTHPLMDESANAERDGQAIRGREFSPNQSFSGLSASSSEVMFWRRPDQLKLEKPAMDHGDLGNSLMSLDSFRAEVGNEATQGAHLEQHVLLHSDSFASQDPTTDEFPPSPSDHQSFLVFFTSSCSKKGVVCERGHLFRIKYYGSCDKPLKKFLLDTVFNLDERCVYCEETIDAHVHCYTHRQGSLTISVLRQENDTLPGEKEEKIWMWHRCLKCPRNKGGIPPSTNRVVMSEAAGGLSFGKFLELSFSNHAAASRVAACGHSLHRDCLRFYGFGNLVACFRYAPVHVYTVHLPSFKLEFNQSEQQDWLRNEVNEIFYKGREVFDNAIQKLKNLKDSIASIRNQDAGKHSIDLEDLLQKQQVTFREVLDKVVSVENETGQTNADILELYKLKRALALCSNQWDRHIRFLASWLVKPRKISESPLLDNPFLKLTSLETNIKLVNGSEEQHYNEELKSIVDGPVVMNTSETHLPQSSIATAEKYSRLSSGSSDNVSGIPSEKFSSLGVNWTIDPDTFLVGTNSEGRNIDSHNSSVETTHGHFPVSRSYSLHMPNGNQQKEDLSSESLVDNGKQHRHLLYHNHLGNLSTHSADHDINIWRTKSDGRFPSVIDLSDTFDAAWSGKGGSFDAHSLHVSSSLQDIPSSLYGSETQAPFLGEYYHGSSSIAVSSEAAREASNGKTDTNAAECVGSVGSLQNGHSLNTSAKLGYSFTDAGISSAGDHPVSGLYRSPSYIRGSQNSLAGSPPNADSRQLSRSSSVASNMGQSGCPEGGRVLLPPGIMDTVIAVYDNEPTSIIAYALISHQYQTHLSGSHRDGTNDQKDKEKNGRRESGDFSNFKGSASHPVRVTETSNSEPLDVVSKDTETLGTKEGQFNDPLLNPQPMHVKVAFSDDSTPDRVYFMVTCYYAKQFDALRKKCCSTEMDFIRSLCRCKAWMAQGGKSKAFFAKTSDDRFVIKQVTKTELDSFIKFAPEYFKHLSGALYSGNPTCLAKILGVFQVQVTHRKAGREARMVVMVMENLLYRRHVTRIYDLKGSIRSRYNADATGKNKVLLDQNLLESMRTNPIFISKKAKHLLERAVWNDTAFLANADVMDYSLLVGVDEKRQELVIGTIDFMRQYTWDKHLETWVKSSLSGLKNSTPTVISPKEYKKRFRKAISSYFLMIPEQWSPRTLIRRSSQHKKINEEQVLAIEYLPHQS